MSIREVLVKCFVPLFLFRSMLCITNSGLIIIKDTYSGVYYICLSRVRQFILGVISIKSRHENIMRLRESQAHVLPFVKN